MKIKDLTNYLESIAPSSYQESYDNAGLIVGDPNMPLKGVMICLDSTEAVIEEAIKKKCNLVIAHHPIVFKGLKKFNGRNYVERVVIKAIKNDVAIYAIHTNLDNVYHQGVNSKIAEKIGLINTQILAPKKGLKKLYTLVPVASSEQIRRALFKAGAEGEQAAYASLGVEYQNGSNNASVKIEVLFRKERQAQILKALQDNHPLVNPNYDIISVENSNKLIGAGMIGEVEIPIHEKAFLKHLKKRMELNCIRYTKLNGRKISKVAICGGAGSFLLPYAKAQKADIFITGDYKYHEFFDADSQLVIADIGHYESEQFTIDLLYEIITNKFSNFAARCTKVNTNPIKYL